MARPSRVRQVRQSNPKLSNRRFERLGKGVYRDRNGAVYRVRKQEGKVSWIRQPSELSEPSEPSEPLIRPIDILVAPDCTPDMFVPLDPSQVPQHPIAVRLDEISRAVQALQPAKADRSVHTIEDAIDLWARGRAVSVSTKAKDRCLTAMLASRMPLSTLVADIDEQSVRELQADLREAGYANTTTNDLLRKVLLPALDAARRQGWITVNPANEVKPLKKIDPDRRQPTWEMASKIVEEAARNSPESAELLRAMLLFGVGQAEIRTVQGEDFDFGQKEIRFRRVKTNKPFSIPFYQHAADFIDGLKAAERLLNGRPVFPWRDPERAFHNACERLKVERYELRALRRVLIIRLLEQEVDPRCVAEWQGHKDTTLIFKVYGKWISPQWRQAQIAKIKAT